MTPLTKRHSGQVLILDLVMGVLRGVFLVN